MQQIKVIILVTPPNIFVHIKYFLFMLHVSLSAKLRECGTAGEADRISDQIGGRGEL